jgi:hypothetical protein
MMGAVEASRDALRGRTTPGEYMADPMAGSSRKVARDDIVEWHLYISPWMRGFTARAAPAVDPYAHIERGVRAVRLVGRQRVTMASGGHPGRGASRPIVVEGAIGRRHAQFAGGKPFGEGCSMGDGDRLPPKAKTAGTVVASTGERSLELARGGTSPDSNLGHALSLPFRRARWLRSAGEAPPPTEAHTKVRAPSQEHTSVAASLRLPSEWRTLGSVRCRRISAAVRRPLGGRRSGGPGLGPAKDGKKPWGSKRASVSCPGSSYVGHSQMAAIR